MEIETIKDIFVLTAKRSALRQYRYHVLDRTRLSEPEIRNVMAKILTQKRIYHGIEHATSVKHKMTGKSRSRSALVDLVIYEKDNLKKPSVWIEFKRGMVEIKNIKKDFIKMVVEPSVESACFFHILPKLPLKSGRSRLNVQKEIIQKFSDAYQSVEKTSCESKWFILFIMDVESRRYYFCKKSNICNIDRLDDGEWRGIK